MAWVARATHVLYIWKVFQFVCGLVVCNDLSTINKSLKLIVWFMLFSKTLKLFHKTC